ncbi:MAG: glycosyltransferase family 61 protein [Pseudomonadota bacterium]
MSSETLSQPVLSDFPSYFARLKEIFAGEPEDLSELDALAQDFGGFETSASGTKYAADVQDIADHLWADGRKQTALKLLEWVATTEDASTLTLARVVHHSLEPVLRRKTAKTLAKRPDALTEFHIKAARRLNDRELAAFVASNIIVPLRPVNRRRSWKRDFPRQLYTEVLKRTGSKREYDFSAERFAQVAEFLNAKNPAIFPMDGGDYTDDLLLDASLNHLAGARRFPRGIAPTAFQPNAGVRPAIHLLRVENAKIVYSGTNVAVLTPNGFLPQSMFIPSRTILDALPKYSFDRLIYAGDYRGADNISHFTFDSMPRALLIARARPKVPVLFNPPKLAGQYQRHLASRLGLTVPEIGEDACVVEAGELFLAHSEAKSTLHPVYHGHPRLVRFFHRLTNPGGPRRKVYVSRADSSRREMANQQQLEDLLKARGFDIVVPTQYEPEQQLAFFAEADVVIAPHGAGLTSIAACSPGTRLLELFSPEVGTAAYGAIATAKEMEYEFIVGTAAETEERFGYTVDIDQVLSF